MKVVFKDVFMEQFLQAASGTFSLFSIYIGDHLVCIVSWPEVVLPRLPVGMTEENAAGTGTVMRTDTLRKYALEAGFRKLGVLPIEHLFFGLYRLTP